jgi:hypothetical protein
MFRTALLAGACVLAMVASASAATLVGLQGDDTLVTFDSVQRQVTATVRVQGVRLHGIDVRPADGMLYGLTRDGRIVTIDPVSGAVTDKSRLNQPIDMNGNYAVDFNPAADRLRVIGQDGSSYRINVDDGATAVDGRIRWADADANRANAPRIVAAAYTNSVRGTPSTTLYDIDAVSSTIVRQAPPNDGVINTVAKIDANLGGAVAFDIATDAQGNNTAFLMVGTNLNTLDLASGRLTAMGAVRGLTGGLKDVAVLRN